MWLAVLIGLLFSAPAWGASPAPPYVYGNCLNYNPGAGGDYCVNIGAQSEWIQFSGDVVNLRNNLFCSQTNQTQCGKLTVVGMGGIPFNGTLLDGQFWCYQASSQSLIPCTFGVFPINVPVAQINNNLNPRYYGASGSSTTTTCNVSASNNTLDCSPGGVADFTVGESIKIALVGNDVLSATPAAPAVTPTCSGSGCTTVGTHTYAYCIMSIDAGTDAALSPCGSLTTVTSIGVLKAQVVDSGGNVSGTNLKNATSWSAASNAQGYVVCRALDGGALIPWAITTGPSYPDWGMPQLGNSLTPFDYGLPATCSTTNSTRNSVFAKITGISGTQVTTSANAAQPVNLAGVAFPSVPVISLSNATVEHDDTPAFRAVTTLIRAASNGTPLVMDIPAGHYNLNPSRLDNSIFFTGVLDLSNFNNVEIKGDTAGGSILDVRGDGVNYIGHFAALFNSISDDDEGRHSFDGCTNIPCFNLTDPVLVNATAVTMTASDLAASGIVAGDFVFIQINQAVEAPFGEMNKVVSTSVSGGTATLTLLYPASHYYSAFPYYGTPPYNSGCFLDYCVGTPVIQRVTPYINAQHLSIHDLHVIGATRIEEINQNYKLHFYNIIADNVFTDDQSGLNRDVLRENMSVTCDSILDQECDPVAAASDNTIVTQNSKYTSLSGMASQACTEGAAHVYFTNNLLQVTGPLPGNGTFFGGGLCFDIHLDGNTFVASQTNMRGVVNSLSGIFEGEMSDNSCYTDSLASTPALIRVTDNPVLFKQHNNHCNIAVPRGANANYEFDPNAGTMQGYPQNVGGMTDLGGHVVTKLANPPAPTGSVCHGSTPGSTSYGPYYAVCHSNVGVSNPSPGFTFTTGPASLSSSPLSCINIAVNAPTGYTSCDFLKGGTSGTVLLGTVAMTGNTTPGTVATAGLVMRDYGQALTSYTLPSTYNNTDQNTFADDPVSKVGFGGEGTDSISSAIELDILSDYVGNPFESRIWTPNQLQTCFQTNTNPAENVTASLNTLDFCQNLNSANEWDFWYTPKGSTPLGSGSQEVVRINRSGVIQSNAGTGSFITELTGTDTAPREGVTRGTGICVGTGAACNTVINESGVFSPTSFFFANIGTALTANGQIGYCADCTIANPCAGSGTGAIAKRLNGVNVCN